MVDLVKGRVSPDPYNLLAPRRQLAVSRNCGAKRSNLLAFVASVDRSHKKSTEKRHPTLRKDPKRFSFKHHSAGFNVQVALHCFESKTMDVHVARGGQNDAGNVHDSDILSKVPEGGRVVVDGGYCTALKAVESF